MLWAKALRSPLPHARIVRIDTSKAEALPGVRCVVTGADTSGMLYGRGMLDVAVLADGRVRFIGERVAAVAADDLHTAEAAVALIDVEYEELPAVLDPDEAIREGAPIIHPDMSSYVGLPRPGGGAVQCVRARPVGEGRRGGGVRGVRCDRGERVLRVPGARGLHGAALLRRLEGRRWQAPGVGAQQGAARAQADTG